MIVRQSARISDPARIGDPATIGDPGEAKIIEEWSNLDANWCNSSVFCGGRGLGTPISAVVAPRSGALVRRGFWPGGLQNLGKTIEN